ncbi:MAG TPA: pilin [Candidatus Paceibacterota bacterium]
MNPTFSDLINKILGYLAPIVPLILTLTMVVFIWGLAQFILASGDEKKIESGKKLMIWGIIGFFVAVSIWGIVEVFTNTFFPNASDLNRTVDVNSLIIERR